jgi:hypothetical protein
MRITLLLLLLAFKASAANRYVDNTASGANNGTNWANAWQSFAAVNWTLVNPGDTVYISGGSASKTYSEKFTMNDENGTAGNPITFRVGQDAGHNGDVIFDFASTAGDGTNHQGGIFRPGNYVHVNGFVGAVSKLHFRNYYNFGKKDTAVCFDAAYRVGTRVIGVTATNINNFADLDANTDCIIAYNVVHGVRGDHFVRLIESLPNDYGNRQVCSNDVILWFNSIEPPYGQEGGYAYGGPDGVQSRHNVSIFNNTFKSEITTNYTSNQHSDMVQGAGTNISIYNNDFINVGDSAIDFDGTNVSYLKIYNNTFRILTQVDDLPQFLRFYATASAQLTLSNIVIANNTFIDNPFQAITFDNYNGGNPTATGIEIKNNIFYNCGNGLSTLPIFNAAISSGTGFSLGAGFLFANNVYYKSGGAYMTFEGVSSTVAAWVSANEPGTGKTNQPLFVSYTANASANDLNLSASDTVAKDSAVTLSYFSTDKAGATRGATWDIGAFEYGGEPPATGIIRAETLKIGL